MKSIIITRFTKNRFTGECLCRNKIFIFRIPNSTIRINLFNQCNVLMFFFCKNSSTHRFSYDIINEVLCIQCLGFYEFFNEKFKFRNNLLLTIGVGWTTTRGLHFSQKNHLLTMKFSIRHTNNVCNVGDCGPQWQNFW